MIRLTRTVRFCINQDSSAGSWGAPDNSYAGYPSFRGLGRFYELEVSCVGKIDGRTGYFTNIKTIDEAARAAAIPAIARACTQTPGSDGSSVLRGLLPALDAALDGTVAEVTWRLTPYHSLQMNPKSPDSVLIRQSFDFAAAHRLHSPELSADENRRIFGKCNNPRGHGHNYRVEPCVEVRVGPDGSARFGLADLERLTSRTIVDRFDHKHLNEDTAEFAQGTGLMPSVENIARVCFELLGPTVKAAGNGAVLRSVTVWETEKTSATFPA